MLAVSRLQVSRLFEESPENRVDLKQVNKIIKATLVDYKPQQDISFDCGEAPEETATTSGVGVV